MFFAVPQAVFAAPPRVIEVDPPSDDAPATLAQDIRIIEVQHSDLSHKKKDAKVEKVEEKKTADAPAPAAEVQMKKVRLTWPVTPSAVRYQVVLLKGAEDKAENVVWSTDQCYTNGIELDLVPYGKAAESYYWKCCPLDYSGRALAKSTPPAPLTVSVAETSASRPSVQSAGVTTANVP